MTRSMRVTYRGSVAAGGAAHRADAAVGPTLENDWRRAMTTWLC